MNCSRKDPSFLRLPGSTGAGVASVEGGGGGGTAAAVATNTTTSSKSTTSILLYDEM